MSIVFSEYSETVCACACSVCVAVWFCLLSVDFGEGLMASYNLNWLVYPRRVSYALIRLICVRKYSVIFNSSNSCAKILSDLAGVWQCKWVQTKQIYWTKEEQRRRQDGRLVDRTRKAPTVFKMALFKYCQRISHFQGLERLSAVRHVTWFRTIFTHLSSSLHYRCFHNDYDPRLLWCNS